MKRVHRAIPPAICLLVGLSIGVASGAAGAWKLSVNGASVSTSAKIIAGTTYVPIRDVARALGMSAQVSGTNITLKSRAVAPQTATKVAAPVSAPATKMKGYSHEELYSQKWGFRVLDVQRGDKFLAQHRNNFNREKVYVAKRGEEIIAVSCRVKNATSSVKNFAFPRGQHGMNTALIDQDGIAYEPVAYDIFAEENVPLGKTASPGTAVPFNIIFRVPRGIRVKELIYSIVVYEELATGQSTDFRVDLVSP